jgi:hypothetical protein
MFKHNKLFGDHLEIRITDAKFMMTKDNNSSTSDKAKSKYPSEEVLINEDAYKTVLEITQEISTRQHQLMLLTSSKSLGKDLEDEIQKLGDLMTIIVFKAKKNITHHQISFEYDLPENQLFKKQLDDINESIAESNDIMNRAITQIL